MTTTTPTTVLIDSQPVPLDQCIWLEQYPCGCIASAVIAVVTSAWTIATAEQAMDHFNPTDRDREHAVRDGRIAVPVTNIRYRDQHASNWRCSQHTR